MSEGLTRREVIQATAGLAMGGAAVGPVRAAGKGARAMQQAQPWYRRTLVGIEIGPTGANDKDALYMSRPTGKEWVANLLRAHAEYGVLFMKDMEFAYYNSRVARKAPNLGDRDLLRDTIAEAKPHGLPIVAYCQIQYDDSSWRAHPEWRMKGADGADLGGRLCYNSGYIEFIKQVAAEMMEYPIAGFHFDMLDYGFSPPVGCWCEHCQRAFRAAYGAPMPPGITWDEPWERMLEFRCASNTRFCQELQSFVKARRPDISVDYNYHGYPPFQWYPGERPVQHARNGDFVTAEGLPWIFGHTNPSLLSLFMAGARPEGPVQGVTSRGVFDYHDFTVRPTAEMKWEVMTYLAHGAQCTIVDKLYYDGSSEPLAYDRIGEVFKEARAKRDTFGHEPLQEVGLYYSSRSRDWFARDDPPKYMTAFWGAHRALVEAHVQLGMVMDESITPDRLRQFPVVYLPNAAILSSQEVALLDEYVQGGGCLLATGLTGLYDRYGQPQKQTILADLLGVRVTRIERDHGDNYLRLPADLPSEARPLLEGVPSGWTMLVQGPVVGCEPAGAKGYGETLVAYRSRDNGWVNHMSAGRAIGPAILVNQRGKGRAVYVPSALDAAYAGDYRMPEHRNLIRNLVRWLSPTPAVTVQAPANVEAVVTRDRTGKRLLVHLLCFSAPPTFAAVAFPNGKRVLPPIMEEPARYEAVIAVREPFARVSAVGRTTGVRRTGGTVRVAVDTPHEVVTFRG